MVSRDYYLLGTAMTSIYCTDNRRLNGFYSFTILLRINQNNKYL